MMPERRAGRPCFIQGRVFADPTGILDDGSSTGTRRRHRWPGHRQPESALKLADTLDRFDGGDPVIYIAEMPIKCPVVQHESACLVDEYLARRGVRGKTELTLVTPLMRKPAHVIAETGNTIIESGVLITDASDRDQG